MCVNTVKPAERKYHKDLFLHNISHAPIYQFNKTNAPTSNTQLTCIHILYIKNIHIAYNSHTNLNTEETLNINSTRICFKSLFIIKRASIAASWIKSVADGAALFVRYATLAVTLRKIDKCHLKSAITRSSGISSCSSLVHVLARVAATAATGAAREAAADERQFYILLLDLVPERPLPRARGIDFR